MGTSGAIKAGRAFVELFADDSKLVRGLRAAANKVKAFGTDIRDIGMKMAGVGIAVMTPLLAASKNFGKVGHDIALMSRRTGIGVEALSELGYAADMSGVDLETFEVGVRRMQKAISAAADGSGEAQSKLANLGLTVADLANLSPEQQFKLIADRMASISNPTEKAAAAMQIFGRSGTMLIPMLDKGAAGIEAFQQKARALGLTISTKDALAAEDFHDTLETLWKTVQRGVFAVGAALAPALTDVAQWLTKVAVEARAWIDQNQGLIVTVLKVAAAVTASGIALVVLGMTIKGVGVALGMLGSVLPIVATAFKAVGAVIGFLCTPVGATIAAVVALGGIFLYCSGLGGKALGWLGDRFKVLADDAKEAWGGIADALASGDIAQAAKILWLTLKMEFTRGVNALQTMWLDFRNFFIRIGYDAWTCLLAGAETVWHGLEVGWIETTSFLSQTWTKFIAAIQQAWAWCAKILTKAWNEIRGVFDDSFNVDAANAAADQAYQAGMKKIESEKDTALADRERKRSQDRDQSKQTHDTTMGLIGQDNLDKHAKLNSEYADQMAQNADELAKARAAWQAAIKAAKDKRAAQSGSSAGPDMPSMPAAPDIGDLDTAIKDSVRGTFNAMAILGLQGGGSAAERTASATERTAQAAEATRRNTQKLLDKQGGLAFS